MILFIAPNPHKAKNREGFLQRVAAIDSLLEDSHKVYVEDVESDDALAQAIIEADLIYVHSVYNANKILSAYQWFSHKIITDLHGVVPEEEKYADNIEMFRVMSETEAEVFKYGKYFVAVTQAMISHFSAKYPTGHHEWIVLPIYAGAGMSNVSVNDKDYHRVVYAGGGQPWQNVELMVDAINRSADSFSFDVLTHDKQAFSAIDNSHADKVTLKGVAPDEVMKYYEHASFGFILRKDVVVNTVACPTKLIEYLCYGVLPIVLSPRIGDFEALGYRYVTLDDFIAGTFKSDDIIKWIDDNRDVYRKFVELAETGKNKLIHLVSKLKADAKKYESPHLKPEIIQSFAIQRLTDKLTKADYQIEVYKQKLTEYSDAVDYYRKKSESESERLSEHMEKSRVHKIGRIYSRLSGGGQG